MPRHPPKTPLELAARAICRRRGLPEDTRFQGAKMWQAHLGEAMAILQAALPPEDFRRLVLDHPWPGPIPPEYRQTRDDPDT
ncbi:hypothetical protein [Ruixingdingia sedimenti]|uniref:DUF2934 family protein n=1 Tax=Ruixingdingia sedimenti TaxID=3073604 RepID=A0ABU1FD64_9RHOB|nr:hypothetical protein [Xinfangfangia sp. LG-4]MDR5654787.1 hypothetical protein [Xinfangfangia sp. LG-4]